MLSNLYTIIQKEKSFFSIKLSNDSHPIFKAHFPNNPILPGFVMMEIFSEVLNIEIKEIKKVKFFNPAYPEDELEFFINTSKILINNRDKKIMEISYA
jgi:3-hydroxyacyl-[acyl-carrier-protein] dehydratase